MVVHSALRITLWEDTDKIRASIGLQTGWHGYENNFVWEIIEGIWNVQPWRRVKSEILNTFQDLKTYVYVKRQMRPFGSVEWN